MQAEKDPLYTVGTFNGNFLKTVETCLLQNLVFHS